MATSFLLCLPLLLCVLVGLAPSACQAQQCMTKLMTCQNVSIAVFTNASEWISSGNRTALDLACNTSTYNNITLTQCIAEAKTECDPASMAMLTTTTDMYCTPNGSAVCQLETTRCQAPVSRLPNATVSVFDLWQTCTAYQDAIRCLKGLTLCKYLIEQYSILQSLQQMDFMCAKFADVPRGPPPPNATPCQQKLYTCSDVAAKTLSGSDKWITTGNRAAMQQACKNESLLACISDTNNTCRDATVISLTNATDAVCGSSGITACLLEAYVCEKTYLAGVRKPGEGFTPQAVCSTQKLQAMSNCLTNQTQCKSVYEQLKVTQELNAVTCGSPHVTWSGGLLLLTALCGHLITAMYRARMR